MTWNSDPHHDVHAVWIPCGTCWGQRTVFTPEPGRGLVASACPTCLGVGERVPEPG